ncbi:Crp/Fnr family transcriptional regulator [Flavitalea flava]
MSAFAGIWRSNQLKSIYLLVISIYFWGMYTQLIHTFERIIRLDDAEKIFIQTLFQEKMVKKGDFFLKEGKVCKEVGFIGKGLARYFINNNGEELVYGFGKENDFICNYESFLDHSPSVKNIQFIENSTILTMSFDNLQLLYEKVKEGQKFGRLVCEQIFVSALKEITSFYTHTPEQRYVEFIASYPDLQNRIPQYYISSFVGVKPPSLSRIRKRLASS